MRDSRGVASPPSPHDSPHSTTERHNIVRDPLCISEARAEAGRSERVRQGWQGGRKVRERLVLLFLAYYFARFSFRSLCVSSLMQFSLLRGGE